MIKICGKEVAWREGITVSDVLKEAGDDYPYALVRVDQKTITKKDFDRFTVPDNSEIFPITLVAGG